LDRMARSLKHLIEALDEFGRLGVDFVCLKQDIDTTSAASRLLFHIVPPLHGPNLEAGGTRKIYWQEPIRFDEVFGKRI
jgi:Resolvase, N terminal domain